MRAEHEIFQMDPRDRLHEVARILATAILRLHSRAALPGHEIDKNNHPADIQANTPMLPEYLLARSENKPC